MSQLVLPVVDRVRLAFMLAVAASALAGETPSRAGPAAIAKPSGWGVREVLAGGPNLPRVLLVGDSILNGYHGKAAELLRGRVGLDVWVTPKHIASKDLPADMKGIFAAHRYDVILFNDIGLHAWSPGRIPEGQYEPLLRAHLANFRKLAPGAKLIFATTTPMTTKTKPIALDPEFNALIVERNRIAVKVMGESHVPVADYYALLAPKLDLAVGDRFHWTRPAYELLAECAAAHVAGALGISLAGAPADAGERRPLWADRAPVGDGTFQAAGGFITVHRPEPRKANGAAVVICPGGGYGGLVVGAEGHGIAQWLLARGVAGIVLEYRLPHGKPFVPLLDAQRAIRTVRANARQWNIDPRRIGIMGFSAGGHLASTAATHFDGGDPGAADPIDRVSCRPDFAVLVYPVITMSEKTHGGSRVNLLGRDPPAKLIELFSSEKQVTDATPPTFLAHAKDDKAVSPENSRMFCAALKAHHVAAEYLELPSGGHGLNGYKGPMWDAWQAKSLEWLAAERFLVGGGP
jgi:acetyl esterase/lipase